MLVAFGWAKIQSSEEAYQGIAPYSFEEEEEIDEALAAADKVLYDNLLTWLNKPNGLIWQFTEQVNNDRGILQFHSSSNHRSDQVWALMDYIRMQSSGSYGVVYIHDDEDNGTRTTQDHTASFRVWRILDGELTEHDDPLFSPFKSQKAFGGSGLI